MSQLPKCSDLMIHMSAPLQQSRWRRLQSPTLCQTKSLLTVRTLEHTIRTMQVANNMNMLWLNLCHQLWEQDVTSFPWLPLMKAIKQAYHTKDRVNQIRLFRHKLHCKAYISQGTIPSLSHIRFYIEWRCKFLTLHELIWGSNWYSKRVSELQFHSLGWGQGWSTIKWWIATSGTTRQQYLSGIEDATEHMEFGRLCCCHQTWTRIDETC